MAVTLSPVERAFVEAQRVGRLATVDARGEPHVVPVCYACDGTRFYTPIDEKPKRRDRLLKRVRNVRETGRAALIIDRYDEDWSRLAWVMVRGRAEILGPEHPDHSTAIVLLRQRYPQYQEMGLEHLPVLALAPERVVSWGALIS
jgi:PPOX class probable F420-dependent enzyme